MKWSPVKKWSEPRLSRKLIASLSLVAGALAVLALTVVLSRPVSPIPEAIRKQVSFPIFWPASHVSVIPNSYEYRTEDDVLLFSGYLDDGQKVTFNEQATPNPFNDIPGYYDQFLRTLFEYQAFDSTQGTVHLTHPKNAGQTVVMNTKGTLLFARVAHDEDKATWQRIFNSLTLYQPL